jgi:hypothetical protein
MLKLSRNGRRTARKMFYLYDKVRVNLPLSSLHNAEGIIVNAKLSQSEVEINYRGNLRKIWFWNDELILVEKGENKCLNSR